MTLVVLFQNAPYDYHSQQAAPGQYFIRTNDFKDLHFNIIEVEPACGVISSKKTGWNLNLLAPGRERTIEGCMLHNADALALSPIRSWISLNLENGRRKRFRQNNSLFMAINNARR